MSTGRKIGILGGTFDPIHNAHLMLGEAAYRQFGLDEIMFMPAKQPPHKTDKKISPVQDRIAMVRLAISDRPYFSCSEFELGMEGKSYTAETLTALHEIDPDARYYFILGADSLFGLDEWYEPDVILQRAVLLAAAREDHDSRQIRDQISYLTGRYGGTIELLYTPMMEISSSDIRRRVRCGERIDEMVPEKVEKYITRYGLYIDDSADMIRIREQLMRVLSRHRYEHTLGVADTARHLAGIYGVSAQKAYLAGLLHDCAKAFSDEELLTCCASNHIPVSGAEEKAPELLHAKCGAWMAKHVYQVSDPEICSAIACHTTGKPGMTLLDKIIFASDYLEPGRNQAPHLAVLRKLAETDLDLTITRILQDTLSYLKEKNAAIDPMTEKTYEWMKKGEHS